MCQERIGGRAMQDTKRENIMFVWNEEFLAVMFYF